MIEAYIMRGEGNPCSGCRARIPNGLVVIAANSGSYCPVCAPQYVNEGALNAALAALVRSTLFGVAVEQPPEPESTRLTLDLDPDEEASFGPGNPADYGDR